MNPEELLYTKDHEWVAIDGDSATIGITNFAAEELGEIVYADVPSLGTFSQTDEFGSVESVKTVSSLYMPLSGEIIEANEQISENPNLISDEPFDGGWLVKIAISDPDEKDELMTHEEYIRYLENLG